VPRSTHFRPPRACWPSTSAAPGSSWASSMPAAACCTSTACRRSAPTAASRWSSACSSPPRRSSSASRRPASRSPRWASSTGANGAAGEWGYMLVDGRVWEEHASPRGLAAAAAQARPGCGLDAEAVFAARAAGDLVMADLVERWFGLLATGLANLLVAFNPARVIVGGGITARGPAFLDELSTHLRARLHPDFHHMCDMALASAGNHAALVGAARLWL